TTLGVLFNAQPTEQEIAETGLGRRVVFHGRALQPSEGFALIAGHTVPGEIEVSDAGLARGISLVGSLEKPPRRLGWIGRNALAKLKGDTEFHLILGASLLRARQQAGDLSILRDIWRAEDILRYGPRGKKWHTREARGPREPVQPAAAGRKFTLFAKAGRKPFSSLCVLARWA